MMHCAFDFRQLARRASAMGCCSRAVDLIEAQRLSVRHETRRGLVNWSRGIAREARRVDCARRLLATRLLRRLWGGWALLAQLRRDRAEADLLRRETKVAEAADRRWLALALREWAGRAKRARLEARKAARTGELWRKVNSWLGDLEVLQGTRAASGAASVDRC